MPEITDEIFMAELRAVAAENPDHVYTRPGGPGTSCMYVHGDTAGCIIGTVLNRLGVPLVMLEQFEGSGSDRVLLALAPKMSVAGLTAASRAQSAQDSGVTWSTAACMAAASYDVGPRP